MVPHPYKNQNLVLNHVAISVPNADEAAEWYCKHFGFRRLRKDMEMDKDQDPGHGMFKIADNGLRKAKVVFLGTGNDVGFELFEFMDPPGKKFDATTWTAEQEYQRGGLFHVSVTVPDPEAFAETVCKDGAARLGETLTAYGEKALYMRDPWGNLVELLSCSYTQMMGNRDP